MAVITSLLVALVYIVLVVLDLYFWVIIIGAVLSWLIAFDVVNRQNRVVHMIGDIYSRLTEPVLRHIRRFVPYVNGIDLSPFVLILGIMFIKVFLQQLMTAI